MLGAATTDATRAATETMADKRMNILVLEKEWMSRVREAIECCCSDGELLYDPPFYMAERATFTPPLFANSSLARIHGNVKKLSVLISNQKNFEGVMTYECRCFDSTHLYSN